MSEPAPGNATPPDAGTLATGAAPEELAAAPAVRDEFDSFGWEVPLLCKDCGQPFRVPYRHFQAGVVFRCSHCRGSLVPKTTIYQTVRAAFESFYTTRRIEQEEFARAGGNAEGFKARQARELDQFHKRLDELARTMRPAGKFVRPKGLRAMFT